MPTQRRPTFGIDFQVYFMIFQSSTRGASPPIEGPWLQGLLYRSRGPLSKFGIYYRLKVENIGFS